MNCKDCNVKMEITPCGAAPVGPCRVHTCPKCKKEIHSKRGVKQPWSEYLLKSTKCANCDKEITIAVVEEKQYGYFCSWECNGEFHQKNTQTTGDKR